MYLCLSIYLYRPEHHTRCGRHQPLLTTLAPSASLTLLLLLQRKNKRTHKHSQHTHEHTNTRTHTHTHTHINSRIRTLKARKTSRGCLEHVHVNAWGRAGDLGLPGGGVASRVPQPPGVRFLEKNLTPRAKKWLRPSGPKYTKIGQNIMH